MGWHVDGMPLLGSTPSHPAPAVFFPFFLFLRLEDVLKNTKVRASRMRGSGDVSAICSIRRLRVPILLRSPRVSESGFVSLNLASSMSYVAFILSFTARYSNVSCLTHLPPFLVFDCCVAIHPGLSPFGGMNFLMLKLLGNIKSGSSRAVCWSASQEDDGKWPSFVVVRKASGATNEEAFALGVVAPEALRTTTVARWFASLRKLEQAGAF